MNIKEFILQRFLSIKKSKTFRKYGIFGIIFIVLLLVIMSVVEKHLYLVTQRLSSNNAEFFTSLMYFSLVNFNIIFILVISFLIFRHITVLVLDRKRGVLGSKLRTKLVTAFVLFAVIPTAVMFFLSYGFISLSFDTWLSGKVRSVMHQTREAGTQVYLQDQKRMESLARIALQQIKIRPKVNISSLSTHSQSLNDFVSKYRIVRSNLEGFEREYQLDSVNFFDLNGNLLIGEDKDDSSLKQSVLSIIPQFQKDSSLLSKGVVEVDSSKDVVRGFAPYYYTKNDKSYLVGIITTQTYFKTQILKSMESILDEFAALRPAAKLVRLGYLVLLIVMVVIIIFVSIWLGFYISRGIVDPIQSLAEVTREVALGNYAVSLKAKVQDETSTLIKAFNRMILDLKNHEQQQESFAKELQRTNKEIEQRREYMEIILQNISAGVISVDSNGVVTSFNNTARKLLNITTEHVLYRDIQNVLGDKLYNKFWLNLEEQLDLESLYSNQIDLKDVGIDIKVFVAASRVLGSSNEGRGIVVVFDDITERVRSQRVAAWREVAQRIAHEIKNPITPIKLNAQRLARRYKDKFSDEDQKVFNSCLESILKQVDSLKDLVNEFSKFARLPKLKTSKQNVNEILLEAIDLYRISYSHVVFDISGLDPDIPLCSLDKEQMSRAFINILTNALSSISMNKGSKIITVRSQRIPSINMIRLEIADNGKGIPDEDKQKVFEPYYSTKKEGTGLGLPIVNQIIGEHGGYIRLINNIPRGLVVVIELPISENNEE